VGPGVWLLLGLCLASTFGLAISWRSYVATTTNADASSRSADLAASVSVAIRRDTDFMAALSATLSAQPNMTNREFAQWLAAVRVTSRYAGGVGYVFIQRVMAADLTAFRRQLQADRPPISRPTSTFTLIPPGVRPAYCIVRIGVVTSNVAAAAALPLGYDYCAAPATGVGGAAISLPEFRTGDGHLPMTVQHFAGGAGLFAIAAPVFEPSADTYTAAGQQAGLRGWAGGTFDAAAAVSSGSGRHEGLRIEVFHQNVGEPAILIAAEGTPRAGSVARDYPLDADGGWLVRITGAPASGWSADAQGATVLAAGLLMSALLFGFVGLLYRARSEAWRTVDSTSEQLRLQSADLLAEKGLLSDVIAAIPQVVYWKDLDGRYQGLNTAFREKRDLSDAMDPIGLTDAELGFDDEFRLSGQAMEDGVLATGEAVVNQRVIAHLPDGTARTMLVSVLPQRSPDGTIAGVIGVGADVSHVSELERVLAQSNRLESIGQLAAGIAHEINTPVQFVSDNVRFLAESFDGILTLVRAVGALVDGPPADQESAPLVAVRTAVAEADLEFLVAEIPTALSESQEGLVRVAEIVRAMKDFSHPGSGRVDTDINRAVESTVQVSRNEWKYVAEVALDLDPAVGMAPCFEGELKQVILNMVVNAAHAIAERRAASGTSVMGTITITTRRDGNSVTVGIGDDGSGMTPEIERRIFDPFFTTKEVGKGTGQGLSLAHDTIVRKHGGRIDVRSKLGVGTTFTLVLPAKVAVDAAAEDAEALV